MSPHRLPLAKPFSLLAALLLLIGLQTAFVSAPAHAATTVGPGVYEETSSAIVYTGSWKKLSSTGSSGKAIRYSASTNASATLTFTGGSITWYTWRTATAGMIDVFLDGVLQTRVDNYAATSATKVRAFSASDLSSGTHTIAVRATGKKNSASQGLLTHVDSFVVGNPPVSHDAEIAQSAQLTTCPAATVTVKDASQLTAALAAAKPGWVIQLAPGRYTGGFLLERSGTAEKPLWVCGSPDAVIEGVSGSEGTALRLQNVKDVRLSGFSVTNALQGVMVKYSRGVAISHLQVHDTGYEGIHLYAGTTDSWLISNRIERSGSVDSSFGEGIYIGTSQRRWDEVTGGQPDSSDRNIVAFNTVISAGAEAIEAKEGTTGGVILGNTVQNTRKDVLPLAWILVTGNGWDVSDNTGSGIAQNGYSSMTWSSSWGLRNHFHHNTGGSGSAGYGVWVQTPGSGSTASCSNTVSSAPLGQTNMFCAP